MKHIRQLQVVFSQKGTGSTWGYDVFSMDLDGDKKPKWLFGGPESGHFFHSQEKVKEHVAEFIDTIRNSQANVIFSTERYLPQKYGEE